jgi:hypothetical protein
MLSKFPRLMGMTLGLVSFGHVARFRAPEVVYCFQSDN